MSYYLKDEIVVPGQVMAQEEEFIEGKGAYIDDNGFIRSTLLGKVSADLDNKIISVKPKNEIKLPKKGNVVVGMVSSIRETIAFVNIYGLVSLLPRLRVEVEFLSPLSGAILNGQGIIDKVNELGDIIKPGDIILAKVLNSTCPYNLSLKGPHLGVIYSSCSKCGEIMQVIDSNKMRCPRCGNIEKRKISSIASRKIVLELKKTLIIS
ncbi:MAG: exosome complex RNA-binding protein Csl4 [Caldisphaeraceae archaeon]|nr:exosome complex RNA-binding protein Csl4 [Caldisphaeraceae archaeon]MEB3691718.1 exosome complex RNA-binding protein Csl4 [Caldisphaeraceae archaeon]MEB3798494.1 exosome complex RNA-binding protein Csl4 [Caldisphaeraceae archaeon]